MKDWQSIESAPKGNDLILVTWGGKSFVEGIDIVRRTNKGWESTLSDIVYRDGKFECYTLLKWMPVPALHPSEKDQEKAESKAKIDEWVANGCEGDF